MSAKSAHKQAARKYIAFMSSEASQAELAKVVIPANKTAAKVWAQQIQKVDVSPYIQTLEVTQSLPHRRHQYAEMAEHVDRQPEENLYGRGRQAGNGQVGQEDRARHGAVIARRGALPRVCAAVDPR